MEEQDLFRELISYVHYDEEMEEKFKKERIGSLQWKDGSEVVLFRNGQYKQMHGPNDKKILKECLMIIKDNDTDIVAIICLGSKRL